MNLIYLGSLTNRVPILPPFTPSHIGGSVPPIGFGEIFDVPRLRMEMNQPLIEWHEIKNRSAEAVQELGCWNTWEAVQQHATSPRYSSLTDRLKLGKGDCKVRGDHTLSHGQQISHTPRRRHGSSSYLATSTTSFPILRLCLC